MRYAMAYLATLIAFVVLDVTWIQLVAAPEFQKVLGPILRPKPLLLAAVPLYGIFAAALMTLAVKPAVLERSLTKAVLQGGLLGLTAYATFDLTNLAILDRWTWGLSLVDMAWGTVLSACAAAAGYGASVSDYFKR